MYLTCIRLQCTTTKYKMLDCHNTIQQLYFKPYASNHYYTLPAIYRCLANMGWSGTDCNMAEQNWMRLLNNNTNIWQHCVLGGQCTPLWHICPFTNTKNNTCLLWVVASQITIWSMDNRPKVALTIWNENDKDPCWWTYAAQVIIVSKKKTLEI